jgi:NADPH2:quinone reductase
MKALCFESYGPPSVLKIKDIPKPVPRKGEALIQVEASAVNPSDVKNVSGHFKSSLPRVPGRDYAGIVVGGDAETGLEVWGTGPAFGVTRDGAHAEYILVPAEFITPKPENLTMEKAAAIGVAYLAAWCSLVTAGEIQSAETILIVGVSGAVGRAATQIAHWKKARVIGASISSDNPSGADAIVNTTTQELAMEVRALTSGKGVDLVLDAVGGPLFEPSLKSLRRGGRQVAIASGKDRRVSFDLVDFYHNVATLIGVDTMGLTGKEIAALMKELRAGFDEGFLQAPEVTTSPLEKAVEIYEKVGNGTLKTKQILIPG